MPATLFRVETSLLIPGRGEPVEQASLIVQGSQITWVGPTISVPDEFAEIPVTQVPFLMPGMWDCHVHLLGATGYDAEELFKVKPAHAGARAARDVAATLDAGFTSIRELAGYGIDIIPAIQDGWIRGPHIYSAGSIISMTAGHDDLRSNPVSLNKENCQRGGPFYVADGVDECLKAVRMQVRRGAKVIKIATTGGVGSADSLHHSQFSPLEIETMVQEAARNGLVVAAHCHGAAGIKAAILGGCKTIEHGSHLDDECIALLKQHDAILVATRSVQDNGIHHPELRSADGYEKIKRVNASGKASYAKAIRAGVKCALGTDIALSSPRLEDFQHGKNALEFVLAVEAGMTPLQAIEAGTATAPETLGPQAPAAGQLRAGYDADMIALSKNPLEDIRVLQKVNNITHVWKRGILEKCSD